MARGPKAAEIFVSEKQRAILEQLIRRRNTAQALAKRARVVLESVKGVNNTAISQLLSFDRPQVVLWRKRWIEHYPEFCRIEQEHSEELEDAIV